MDLKDRIKNLADATTSKEVKALCQTYLNESEGKGIDKDTMLTESLFNDLKKAASNDDLVAELLNETDSYAVNKRKIEAKISGRAAAMLMENWKTPTSGSPVGNLKNNALENDNKNKAAAAKVLNEGLTLAAKTDPSAGKVLKDLRVESYGIAEAIQTIKTSKIMSTPQLKYAITRFETHLENNVSESRFVKEFLSNMAGFAWDPTVSEAYSSVKTLADAKSVEIEVQNAIQIIAESDKKNFFDQPVKLLNQWLMNDKRSIPGLVNEMKQWMFNPVVKDLVKHVQLLENSYGNKFNVPVSASNCSISKIYSPVHMVTEGTVFRAGDTYFLSSKEGISTLTEGQVNSLPVAYTTLCEQFFNGAVRVSDEGIHVNIGSTKVTINEHGTFIGESAVEAEELGQKLMMYTQQTMFKSDNNNLITVAVKLQENQDAIAEIDYGKSVFSNLYENVGVYIFRKNDKIFINKVNPSMNENTFNEANAVQAVNMVKGFLNYDLSESLIDMLDGDLKKKSLMESAMTEVLSNITLVESEIDKIENAIAENADLADVEEIQKAKEMLESELNKLKSVWHAKSTELEAFVTVMENEDALCESCDCNPCECKTEGLTESDDDDEESEEEETEEKKEKKSDDDSDVDDEESEEEETEEKKEKKSDDDSDVDDSDDDDSDDDSDDDGDDDPTPGGGEELPTEEETETPEEEEAEDDENALADEESEEAEDDSDLEKKNDVEDADVATVLGDEEELEELPGDDAEVVVVDADTDGEAPIDNEEIPADDSEVPAADDALAGDDEVPALDGAEDNMPSSGAEVVVNDEMTDAGLAGAEGAQTQTQEIAGNDHIDAAAGDTEGPAEQENNLVSDGHAGAGEGQTQAQTIPGAANAMAVAPTGEEAEISIPANIETASVEQQADTSSEEIGDTAAGELPAETEEAPIDNEEVPTDDEIAGDAPIDVDTEEETTTDDESTVDQEVDQDDVEPMGDNNYEEDEKSNEALNTFLTSKGLDETEIATIASYIGEGSLAAKLHNGSPKLMAKVMPFVRDIATIIQESGAKKVGNATVTREAFVSTVNEAFYGTTQNMANRIITAYDNIDVDKPSRLYDMAMNESVSGDVTGRKVLEITHKAVTKLAYYNETDKFDAVLESIQSVLTAGKKKSSPLNEALDVNVKVCMKGSEKHGVITSINSAEQMYTVLWDGGETGDYGQDQLEDLSAEIADNDNDNAQAGEAANKKAEEEAVSEKKTEVVTESKGSEEESEEDDIKVWTKAKVTIDFGPFKEDEVVTIDASQFVAAGDQDAIKLKEPKDEISTIPKKYLKVQDGGEDTSTELSNKLENALKSLEDAETLLQSEDKINKQEISDAVGKIKAFKDALKSGE